MHVVGKYAYLTDEEGLYVIDVSKPTNLRRVGFCGTSDSAYGVKVVGECAYVAAGGSGVCLIDISDPSSPEEVGSCGAGGAASGVDLDGSLVCAADTKLGLLIMRVSENLLAKKTT